MHSEVAVAAVEVTERRTVRSAAGDDPADEDRVRAGRVFFGEFAIEIGESFFDDGRAREVCSTAYPRERIGGRVRGERTGEVFLVEAQQVDAEATGLRDDRVTARKPVDADEDEWGRSWEAC